MRPTLAGHSVVGTTPRLTFISWADSCSRSDHLARELGGKSHMVYAAKLGSHPITILLKYAVQWCRTARILNRERPDTVFVMIPPVFAALPAFWYAWWYQKQVVLDAHTCAFVLPRWRPFQWLHRVLFRRARTTIVTNEHLANIVRATGAHATIVADVPVVFAERTPFLRPAGFIVAVVCSFDQDEPIDAILDAAAAMPDVCFQVTGDPQFLQPEIVSRIPRNVTLTGFLSTPLYAGLLTVADVVIDLTTVDHTMLRGAYEAIYQGTPVIVSDWPVLRHAFPAAAAYVDNTPQSIVAAIRSMQSDLPRYRAEAKRLRESKLSRWVRTRRAILHVLGGEETERTLSGGRTRRTPQRRRQADVAATRF